MGKFRFQRQEKLIVGLLRAPARVEESRRSREIGPGANRGLGVAGRGHTGRSRGSGAAPCLTAESSSTARPVVAADGPAGWVALPREAREGHRRALLPLEGQAGSRGWAPRALRGAWAPHVHTSAEAAAARGGGVPRRTSRNPRSGAPVGVNLPQVTCFGGCLGINIRGLRPPPPPPPRPPAEFQAEGVSRSLPPPGLSKPAPREAGVLEKSLQPATS